jgi:hypothetical protein
MGEGAMGELKRIHSLGQIRADEERVLTECYVVGIGFHGLSALAENPVAPGSEVFVDLTYVGTNGGLEGETVRARASACERHAGGHLIHLAFHTDFAQQDRSGLGAFIRRELGLDRPAATPPPPPREIAAGSS